MLRTAQFIANAQDMFGATNGQRQPKNSHAVQAMAVHLQCRSCQHGKCHGYDGEKHPQHVQQRAKQGHQEDSALTCVEFFATACASNQSAKALKSV